MRPDKGTRRGKSPLVSMRMRKHWEKVRKEAVEGLEERMRAAHCRRLTGREFARRKAELEAIDRREREGAA